MAQGRKEMSRNEQVLRREQGWGGAGESLHFRALKLEVGKPPPCTLCGRRDSTDGALPRERPVRTHRVH